MSAASTASTARLTPSSAIAPVSSICSARRVGSFTASAGNGGAPGWASTIWSCAEFEPMSSTPSRIRAQVPRLARSHTDTSDPMETFNYTATADLPADEAFAFISDAPNLPRLLPQNLAEGWLSTDPASRQLVWGTESDGDDCGELRVIERGPALCEIAMTVHTRRADSDQVRTEMKQAVAALTHQAAADADVQREGQQAGWA